MNHISKLPLTLLPKVPGLRLEDTFIGAHTISLTLASTSLPVACPMCGHTTARLHSHYRRTVADLPWSGLRVRLLLGVRKFRCSKAGCPRRIFTERLPSLMEPYARKTTRLHEVLKLVGFALGGEAGARLIRRLGIVASPTTLLRYVRGAVTAAHPTPEVIGVDDFALLCGKRYGTIIVDLERHRLIELLPDRSAGTLSAWLKEHPAVRIISRDRSTEYERGIKEGAPTAVEILDRWHLLKNLREAAERVLEHNHEVIPPVRLPSIAERGPYSTMSTPPCRARPRKGLPESPSVASGSPTTKR